MKKLLSLLLALALLAWLAVLPAAAEDIYAGLDLAGTPSDYSDADNWLAIPEIMKAADTVYFYPTAYDDRSEAATDICAIDNAAMREKARELYEQQATAFEDATNVFAPYYRQSNIYAVMEHADDPEPFQKQEQRTDVFAALDYYFTHYNNGRPFLLAGHSQGSMMIRIVLDEYMPLHPDYLDRMVAAYAIGESFTDDWLAAHTYLKFAEGADDTGVIVAWNTEGPGNADAFNFVVEEGNNAINPINWKRDDTYAPASESLGSREADADGSYVLSVPGKHDAQLDVERGVVVCTTSDSFVPLANLFGPKSLHGVDYDLYYGNIRENAKTRVAAYLAKHTAPSDLTSGAWYAEGVEYVLEHGLMTAYGDGSFHVNDAAYGAEAVAALWKLAGSPEQEAGSSAALRWAASEGLTDTAFDLDGSITREDLAVLLYKYAQSQGLGFTGSWMFLLDYADAAEISEDAGEAMHWMVMKGVLNGTADGYLHPKGVVTRAQLAVILERYAPLVAPVKAIDMEHHYYMQEFLDIAEARDAVPRYNSETKEIEYVDGVWMGLGAIIDKLLALDDSRVAEMDAWGLTTAMLEVSPGVEVIEGEQGVELCKLCNDLVYGAMQKYPGRFLGSATLPLWDVEASVAELERCVKDYGFVSWHTHSNYGETHIDDEQYRPILEKCAELGAYVYVHPSMPAYDRINDLGTMASAAGLGFTVDTMTTLTALVTSGAFDEIPELHVVSGHFGEALPFLLTRMDSFLTAERDATLKNQHEFSWYFKHNIWVTTSGNMQESAFELTKEMLGIDRILLGTDYPYESLKQEMTFLNGLDLTRAEREALYYKNAEALMGIG